MPDKQNGTPAPTKAQLAGYIRSVNKSAAGLSDDQIMDKLVSASPKIGKLVSDYANPLIQGPVPLKGQMPLAADITKSALASKDLNKPKSIEQEFNDVEVLRAKASISGENYDAAIQPGGFNADALKRQEKYKIDALKYGQQADELFQKFQSKFNSDAGIQKLKNDIVSKQTQFTAKDNLGSTYVDNAKLRSYVRSKYPASANTQFEDYLVNNIGSDILFETKKPALQEKIVKMAKEKKIDIPQNFLDLNKDITKKAQSLSDNVSKQITNINTEATSEISNLNNAYKSATEQIKQKYSNPDFVRQNFQTDEEFRAAYQKEIGETFDEYSRNFSSMNSRYSSLAAKLKGDYERSMKELEVKSEQQRKDVSQLMKQALIDINEEDNSRRLALTNVLDSINPFAKGQTFGRSLVSGIADWTSNIATNLSMGNDWQWTTDFQDFASNTSKKLSTPSVEIKSIKQLVDPTQFGLSSGKMIGQMLPAIGAAMATRGALGPGFGTTLAAGTLQWFDEASQARASNYNAMIEQGLDPEEAKNRSAKTYSGYLATLPLSMIQAEAMFGKFGGGSMLRKLGTNIAAEIPSETLQEVIQNESDEAIVNNRQLDFGKMFDVNNVYKTALNVAPASIVMPIPGSIVESSRENLPISQTANWAMRVSTAPIQSMANNITQNGLFSNIASLEAMRHNGVISEEGMNSMKGLLNEVNSDMETGKASGLNKKQQSVYAGLMSNVRNLQDAANQVDAQDMTQEAKQEAMTIANKRVENAREVAADYLKTKNGNYAEVVDKDGDKYIVSHDELNDMLADESFQNDVRGGNARVELYYNKKAGEQLGSISKQLLGLNKNYNEGLREYSQSEKNLNALRKKLGIEEQPTQSTTLDGLIGQPVVYRVNKFPTKINMKGVLAVENGNLILDTQDGGSVRLGRYNQMVGVHPSDINIEFEPQAYQGPKMTKEQAKLPSLLAMFGGKVEPKTLAKILSDVISDVKKSDINKMVKAFDTAYQRKVQQKSINESLPKPTKKIDVVEPEIGVEYEGNDVSSMLAQVGDKSAKSFLDKIMSFSLRNFVASNLDLDDLYENSEEFRNRVEAERGEKADRFTSEYSNTEKVPAVVVDGKVKDGLGRLARLYINGDKIATVFENIKTKENAITEGQRPIQEGGTEGRVSERQRTEEVGPQAETAQADTRNRNISGQAITVEPAIAKVTSDNIDELDNVKGNKLQKKVLNDVKKVVAAIGGSFKITVNIHNQDTFTQAVLEAGGTQEESTARGFYMSTDGSIHLNMDKVKSDTMLHEGFHPILDFLQANNPKIIDEFFSQLEAIPEAADIIRNARENYTGDTNQKKEAITDFVAGIADRRIILNPNNFQKIKAFVLNMLNKIGIGEGQQLMNVTDEQSLINLANFVTEKFRGGEEITYESLGDFVEVKPTRQMPIARSGQLQFSKTIYDKSGIEKSPALDRSEFKKAVSDGRISVVNPYQSLADNSFAITFPDDFFTGEIKFDKETIAYGNGGVFFAARFGQRGDVWAAAGENSANNFVIQGNESRKRNNGEGIIVLSKGDDIKHSTSLEANIAFINTIIKYADKNNQLEQAVKAIKTAYTVGRAKSAETIIDSFNQFLAGGRGESGQRMVDAKSAFNTMSSALIKEARPLVTKMLREMGFDGEQYFDKTKLKKGEYLATTQGLKAMYIDMLQEDFLKGVNNGAVYAALRFDSDIKFERDTYHPSYPYVIRTVDGSPVRLEVFSKTFNSYGKSGVAVYGQDRNTENAFGVATTTKPDFKLDPSFEDNPSQNDLSAQLNGYNAFKAPQFQKVAPTRSKFDKAKDMVVNKANLSDAQLEKIAKGITLWEQWATSYGLMGKDVKVAEEYKEGYVSNELYKADKAVKNVVKEIERAKKAGLTITDEDITNYLTGSAPVNNIPTYLKRGLNVMRVHIDSLTEEMILNGVINDPEEIQQFRDNKGKYLGRFYDMFINGKGLTLNNIVDKLKDVDGAVIEKARNLIRSEIQKSVKRQNPNLSQAELDAIIDNKVDDVLNAIVEDIGNPYAKKAMKGSVNMKQLMARQNIVEPIRALMGEIKNPVSRYYATIGKMSSIVAGMRYLNEVRQIGMGNFLFEANDPNRPKGTVRITSDTNKNLEPLAGLYTFPEIRDEFASYMIGVGSESNIVSKAIGFAKYMNTVGNLPTHVKNIASNVGILVNNGYIFDVNNAIQFILNEPDAFGKAYEELRKSGALNNNINATELKSYFEKNNDIDKILNNKFKPKNPLKVAQGALTDLYNAEDDIFKVISFICEAQRYSKALYKVQYSDLSNRDREKINKKSVEIVKSILPLYTRVPPFVKGMNKYLYLGTFMSFTAESIRISKNTALLALRELGDPETRIIGAKRLGGIVAWNTAYGWGTTASAAAVGSMATGAFTYWLNALQQLTSDDDDEHRKRLRKERSIRRVVRDYNMSSDIFLSKASGGNLTYIDMGSVNPYNFISNFLNRFDQLSRDEGEGVVSDIINSVGYSLSPFVKQDFIIDKMWQSLGALSGKIPEDNYGKPIYNESDPASVKRKELAKYVTGIVTPGMIKSGFKYYDMIKEGNVDGANAELMSALTLRKVSTDLDKWFYIKVAKGDNSYINELKAQKSTYYSAINKNISNEEKDKAYTQSVDRVRGIIDNMSKDYIAALDIGVEDAKIYDIMVRAGMKDYNIAAVIEAVNGDVKKLDPALFVDKRH